MMYNVTIVIRIQMKFRAKLSSLRNNSANHLLIIHYRTVNGQRNLIYSKPLIFSAYNI